MIHDGATPKIDIDPETYDVRADGELLVPSLPTKCRWRKGIFALGSRVNYDRKSMLFVQESP
jgi:hypothetical protein